MIDDKLTFEKFGYTASDLAEHSKKRVVAICHICNEPREIFKRAYRDNCGRCSRLLQITKLTEASVKARTGTKHSEETKLKQSIAHLGEKNPNYGKMASDETREKMSLVRTKHKNPFYGRRHTEESKKLMSETRIRNINNPNLKIKNIEKWIRSKIRSWKRRTISSNLTFEYLMKLYELQNGKCYYTNKPLKILHASEWKTNFRESISLDRLDPEKGYVKGNVVYCLYSINTMKGSFTEMNFYNLMKDILYNKGILHD